MIALDWNPDTRKLKQFGIISLVGFGVIGLMVAKHLGCFNGEGNWLPSQVLWGIGGISLVLAFLRPVLLKPLYILLSIFALPIGLVVSNLLLFLIYWGLFVTTGLLLRLTGRDPLGRKTAPDSTTYWVERQTAGSPERYFHQY